MSERDQHAPGPPCLPHDQHIPERGVGGVAEAGDEPEDESPAEAEPAEGEAAVEAVRAALDGGEELRVGGGEAGGEGALGGGEHAGGEVSACARCVTWGTREKRGRLTRLRLLRPRASVYDSYMGSWGAYCATWRAKRRRPALLRSVDMSCGADVGVWG